MAQRPGNDGDDDDGWGASTARFGLAHTRASDSDGDDDVGAADHHATAKTDSASAANDLYAYFRRAAGMSFFHSMRSGVTADRLPRRSKAHRSR